MKFHVITAAELNQAGCFTFPLLEDAAGFKSVSLREADFHVLPIRAGDLRPGDITTLVAALKIDPRRIIVLDPDSDDELDVPEDSENAIFARAHYRAGELKNLRVLALPPRVSDLGEQPAESFDFDCSFVLSVSTGAETAAFESIDGLSRRRSARSQTYMKDAILGYVTAAREKDERGIQRVAPGLQDPRELVKSTQAVEAMLPEAAGDRPFRADARKVNVMDGDRTPSGMINNVSQDSARLIRAALGDRPLLGTGIVDLDDLRQSLRRSRAGVAVQRFNGGSIPARVVECASAGRACFLIGSAGALPFQKDCDEWLFQIPFEDVRESGPLIFEKLRHMSDSAVREAGRAARAWFDQVKPDSWAKALNPKA